MPTWKEVFDSAEKSAAQGSGQSEKLGPGHYVAKITGAKTTITQKGNPRFLFTLWTPEGVAWLGVNVPYEGCHRALGFFFTRDMGMLGITPAMLDANEEAALKSAVGAVFRIEIKQQKDSEYLSTELIEELARTAELGPCEAPSKPEPAEPIPDAEPGEEGWEPF